MENSPLELGSLLSFTRRLFLHFKEGESECKKEEPSQLSCFVGLVAGVDDEGSRTALRDVPQIHKERQQVT